LKSFSIAHLAPLIAIVLVGTLDYPIGRAQRVPQVTGWTFSRSYGGGVGNSTATTAISESNGAESFSRVNVLPVSQLDPDGNFVIQDPDAPFSIGVKALKAEQTVRQQQLNYFSLSDWGYSVFSN